MKSVSEATVWSVQLVDGQVLEIWADSYSTTEDHYEFGTLVELEDQDRDGRQLVLSTTPSNAKRVVVAVARIPKLSVALGPEADPDWPNIATCRASEAAF